ncbi:DMT family transporter [Acidihalobacter ferrooxydans]|uniref:EamA family transporter n=1 Tax=Acidihalobacter ferrooxydans TaxID=1765967 RepID=A0A1P8UL19_9GAMM|nr:DMT family transporter [Acidihalobacter ferrooxydans]APZ44530.1 EamA family transporter [Acidihalobacter ferrooxydans]
MNSKSLVQLLSLAAIWGGSFLFMRICAPVLGAVPTAFGRVLFGALGLIVLLIGMRIPLTFGGRIKFVLAIGAINSGLPFLMFSLAAEVLPAGYSAIINSMTPLMGVIIGASFFGEAVTIKKLGGVTAGLFGVWVLTETGPTTMSTATILGIIACLVATICYGFAGYLTKLWITGRGIDNRVVAFGSQAGAVLLLAPVMAWHSIFAPIAWAQVSTAVWASMLGLGLVCTSFAYLLYFQLINDVGPLKAMGVTFLVPVFGVLWGWLLLGERLSLGYALGGVIIGVALWLVIMPNKISDKIPSD